MRSPRVLAVDIGAGHVACGVFVVGASGRLVLQHFALESHDADPGHEARWPMEITQSLGAVAARTRLGGAASLAVPGHLALTKFLKTPSVAKEKRAKILAFEAGENIPYPLDEVVWDYVVLADDSFDLDVMLTAAKFDAMQSLCAAADAAGFAPEHAMPAGFALYRAFRYNYPDAHENTIVVNVGARSTTLLFVDGGRFYLRTLPLAGNTVTQAVAEELRIDFAAAEMLKRQVATGRSDLPAQSPSRAAVERASAAFAHKLLLEITRSTVNYRRLSGAAEPVALYLTGGGAQWPELPGALADKLRLPVQPYDPLRHVDLAAAARAAGADAAAPVLADLVGLATGLVSSRVAEVSLLPPALTRAIAFRKRQPWFIAAAVCLVLALLPPIVFFHRLASHRLEQIAQIDGQLMPLRALQQRNEDNLRRIEEAKKRIAALAGAFETKTNWGSFLGDLQSRLAEVENVWLDSVHIVRPSPESAPRDGAAQTAAGTPPAGEAAPVDGGTGRVAPPLKLTLSGRLLDAANPQSKVSPESFERVKQLLQKFRQSPFVAAVENERFDNSQNGLLRFTVTLAINPQRPL